MNFGLNIVVRKKILTTIISFSQKISKKLWLYKYIRIINIDDKHDFFELPGIGLTLKVIS